MLVRETLLEPAPTIQAHQQRRLLLVRVSNQRRQQIAQNKGYASDGAGVPVDKCFEPIIDGLNQSALAQRQPIYQSHRLILQVLF